MMEQLKKACSLIGFSKGTMLLLIVLAHAPLYLYLADPGIMHRVESGSFDQIVNLFGIFILITVQEQCLPYY